MKVLIESFASMRLSNDFDRPRDGGSFKTASSFSLSHCRRLSDSPGTTRIIP